VQHGEARRAAVTQGERRLHKARSGYTRRAAVTQGARRVHKARGDYTRRAAITQGARRLLAAGTATGRGRAAARRCRVMRAEAARSSGEKQRRSAAAKAVRAKAGGRPRVATRYAPCSGLWRLMGETAYGLMAAYGGDCRESPHACCESLDACWRGFLAGARHTQTPLGAPRTPCAFAPVTRRRHTGRRRATRLHRERVSLRHVLCICETSAHGEA
jgi:hypothetical protein